MGRELPRAIRRCAFLSVFATGVCLAQDTVQKELPDVPVPIVQPEAGSTAISTRHAEPQQLPSFSVGLSARQKYVLAYRRIVSPQMPLKAVFVSGWELGTETGPDIRRNGWAPFAERFGYNAASISTTIFFNTAFVPVIVHQDPRYFPLGYGSVKGRIGWALRSEFLGFRDDGHTMPNYSNLVGFGLSSIVINAFTPRSSASFGDTIERYAIKIGISAGMNVGREFDVFDRVKAVARHSRLAGK